MDLEDYDRSELTSAINSICDLKDDQDQTSASVYTDHDYSNQCITAPVKEEASDDEDRLHAIDYGNDRGGEDALFEKIALLSKTLIQLKIDSTKLLVTMKKMANITLDKADEILRIEMYNSWGRCLETKHVRHKTEITIQDALKEWTRWKMKSPYRDTPLLYVCNDCAIAWWHLGPFREHLHEHDPETETSLKIHLECNFHECNLVARFVEKPNPEMAVEVASDCCWKCGQDYLAHGVDKYVCAVCNSQCYTCIQMVHHYGTCLEYRLKWNKRKKSGFQMFPCHICNLLEYTKQDLYHHYETYHAVRSDRPTGDPIDMCSLCDKAIISPHVCPKMCTEFLSCELCDRKFSCLLTCTIHENTVKKHCCVICNKVLPSPCLEATHVAAQHGRNFLVIYRCILCDDNILFLNEDAMRLHVSFWHKRECNEKDFMERVVLPKACVISLFSSTGDVSRVYVKGNYVNVKELQETASEKIIEAPGPASKKRRNTRKEKRYMNVIDKNLVLMPIFGNESEKNKVEKIDHKENDIEIIDLQENYVEIIDHVENYVQTNVVEDDESCEEIPYYGIENIRSEAVEISAPRVTVEIEENIDPSPDVSNVKEEIEDFNDHIEDMDDFHDHIEDEPIPDVPRVKVEIEDDDFNDHIVIKNEVMNELYDQDDEAGYEQILSSVFGQSNLQFKEDPEAPLEIKTERDEEAKPMEVIEILDESDSDVPLIFSSTKKKKDCKTCKKCGFKGTKSEYEEHLPKCLTDYLCTKCENGYRTISDYALHYIMHGYLDNHCPKCDQLLVMGASLAEHVQKHVKSSYKKDETTDENYQCSECDKSVQVEHLFVHWESHLELEPYDPSLESSKGVMVAAPKLLSKKKVQYVIKILQENKQKYAKRIAGITCKLCRKSFQRDPDLKRHLIEHLLANATLQVETDSSFKCPICECRLYGNNQFRSHLRNHSHFHTQHQCEICLRSFSDSSNRAKHRKTHNIAAHTCSICKKKFHSKKQFEKHQLVHQTQKSIKCKCCKKIFKQWSDYRRHKRNLLQKIIKRYPCQLCKKKFHTMKEKWTHQWEVHKLRDDESDCPICLKPFRRLIDVKRHLEEVHEMCTGPKESRQLRNFFLVRKLKKLGGETVDGVATELGNTSSAPPDENV